MVAARSYRDDMQCPHCGSNWLPKDGHSRGKQTYRCGSCRYRFTPDGNRHYYSEQVKEQAIDLYGEGMAVAAISRVLAVNLGTLYEWIKKVRWALKIWAWVQRQRHSVVPAISFDEMWTYQQARHSEKRREVWIWTAVIEPPDGRRCVDIEVGDRSGATFLRLYERLPDAEAYYGDECGVYGSWLPAGVMWRGRGSWRIGTRACIRSGGVVRSGWRGRRRVTRSGCGFCVVRWRCCVCVRGRVKNPMPARAENTDVRGTGGGLVCVAARRPGLLHLGKPNPQQRARACGAPALITAPALCYIGIGNFGRQFRTIPDDTSNWNRCADQRCRRPLPRRS